MLNFEEDIDNPQLFTHFGTSSPCWRLTTDSDALDLSGDVNSVTVSVELSPAQARDVRSMTGVTSSIAISVTIFGNPIRLHLVGRKTDTWLWGGTAAQYGDTDTVAKDLESGLSFAEQVVSEVNSLVVIIDSAGKIQRFNRLCEEVTGVMESDVVGKNALDLFVHEKQREDTRSNVNSFFHREKTYETLRPINTKKGVRIIKWRNTIIESGSGVQEKFLVCSGTDVTDELRTQERMVEMATTDMLTGLPNRNAIQDKITTAIAPPNAEAFALIFLDLDNFKKVNDHYGHITGDELIKEVSVALSSCLTEKDVLARIGGDEFLIMIASPSQDVIEATAQRILERMKLPFHLKRTEVYSGCSIGIAMFPEHGANLEELIRSADTAMYVAKDNGKRTFCIFSREMNKKASEYVWLDTNMRNALADNQFELYYQPKVSLLTGKVDSVEALIRWNHPERGLIMPGEFIPYAEETGLIVPLGRWVMETAAKQAGAWKKQGLNVRVAINISARQLRIPTIIEDFTKAILSNDLCPSMVDIELTESCLIEDEKLAHRLIRMFRELGAEVHLDDFGTGYSSLSQLSRLPLDVIKLDGSFIHSIHTDAKAQALVRSMVAVGHELSLKIVAECVETPEQAEFLRNIGIDYAQGYLFAKPMKLSDFNAWMPASSNKVVRLVTKARSI
ncbi:cyclic di-GMP phosphodiesterase [Glaciimonas sp. CA11.2]|uniref:cyclic di-GMP phosphodiesterase n=1 Tax=unclassified Glaciimonas TaxID=2644401 RepID=UPI002AB3FF34|nr:MULTISPECIES: cyclic di-GMP phosphodiesterase [unclassified Glaciimonas]MDY7547004.1 cyclic di-GMP phosphodiesterase [Glaciimonas sp. CA11.2]MEB0011148.1 cyclic di-GMP phosphodiesterase [Glaciimonas sp. Cout2]MEB0081174.1 cyclic di-GMP phosphodiesterase [Glaciimonas sp. Gout2]MEB0164120.1 cyclic di-GMP phosphodiesterase [Glaciimonas sp. CA11.2]